jgi:cytochrome b involved in lipid metabolism
MKQERRKKASRGNGSSLVAFQNFLKSNKNPNTSYEKGVTPLTMVEVAKHKSSSDCWTVFQGVVYNITPFLEYHPGGKEELMRGAGLDCTDLYMKYHAWVNADAVLGKLRIGKLDHAGKEQPISSETLLGAEKSETGNSLSQRIQESGSSSGIQHQQVRVKHLSVNTSLDEVPSEKRNCSVQELLGTVSVFRAFNSVRN